MLITFLLILIALPAFFAASEVSLLRLRPIRVQGLVDDGNTGAQAIKRLQRRLRRSLIISQLGVTLALISVGWIGKGIALRLWSDDLYMSRYWDFGLFLLIVLMATLFGGLLPKALVLNRPEEAALRLAPLLEAVMRFLAPLLVLLELVASLLFRLVRLNTQWDSLIPALSAEELETLIETGGVTGLQPDERNILEGVFALRDTQVREVMIPRSRMVTLPIDVEFAELMKEVHKTRHARFPVIGESLDDVRGVIDLREMANQISKGTMKAETKLEPYLLSAPMVLETSSLSELLPLFRSGKPLLLVVDEHGGTEGLVTAADLTGEIVGEDIEPDNNGPDIEPIENQPNKWLVAGDLEIIDLNRQLQLELPEADDHHTLAGFLLEKLQHVPLNGEILVYEDITFEINKMNGPRIELVKLTLNTFPPGKEKDLINNQSPKYS